MLRSDGRAHSQFWLKQPRTARTSGGPNPIPGSAQGGAPPPFLRPALREPVQEDFVMRGHVGLARLEEGWVCVDRARGVLARSQGHRGHS